MKTRQFVVFAEMTEILRRQTDGFHCILLSIEAYMHLQQKEWHLVGRKEFVKLPPIKINKLTETYKNKRNPELDNYRNLLASFSIRNPRIKLDGREPLFRQSSTTPCIRAAYDNFFADSQNYFIVPRLKSELSKYYNENKDLQWTESWTKIDDFYLNEFVPNSMTDESTPEPIDTADDTEIGEQSFKMNFFFSIIFE